MAELDVVTFKTRLREVFGEVSQEVTGKKIGVGQGNVSKLVSFASSQLPRADTLFRIAEEYNVSIDWLLGISEKKQIIKTADAVSYASAVRALVGLCQHQIAAITDESGTGLAFKFDDSLIKFLVQKSLALSKADTELYQNWIETRLVEFEDKPLIFSGTWSDENIDFLAGEASVESEWLQVHNAAIAAEEEYAEMMGPDESPFFEG